MEKPSLAAAISFLLFASEITLTRTKEPLTAERDVMEVDKEKDPEYYRLPGGVSPQTYELRIIPFLEDRNLTFKGDVTIKLLIHSTTRNITLHSKSLIISEIKIFELGPPKVEIPLDNFLHFEDRDFLVVESKMALAPNETYSLYIKFEGELNGNNDGFYRSSYFDSAGKLQWLATTQFEPLSARMAFPCFDEPQLKSNFSISVARPRGMNTLSNMGVKGPPVADPNLPEKYVWDNFEETPKMSTYLVAFIVSNFTSGKTKSQEFRVWAREEYVRDVEYSQEIGPKVLDVIHNITLTKYPLPKMDMIAIPDFYGGAMENWGLVTYRESLLLFNNETSSTANKQRTTSVVAHELAHQWFGNLVSPEWWTWLWLNEGFATYFAKAAVERIEPSWRIMEQFVVEDLHPALLTDSRSTHPINYNIRNPMDVEEAFDDIAYKKAGSVIRMMAHFLSEDTFSRGLRTYLLRRKYNSAKDVDLFEAMDIQLLIDRGLPVNYSVSEIMNSWTTQAGYPIVTVKRDIVNHKLVLHQERFTLDRLTSEDNTGLWCIPITFTSMMTKNFNETNPVLWMKERTAEIQMESNTDGDNWILFNLQQSGFYRVNYDEGNWKFLSDYLNTENYRIIPPVNRAQLIDDALNLARAGHLNYSVALNLTSYLVRESDYIPLYSAYQGFSFLETRISESNELKLFKAHMRNLMKSYYSNGKFEETPEDDHLIKLSRTSLLLWACKYNYDNCVSKAFKLFNDWKENRTKSITPNLRRVVYCIGVEQGVSEEWNYLWKAFQMSSVATEKDLLLKSLGCSTNKTIIHGYVGNIKTYELIRSQNNLIVLNDAIRREGFCFLDMAMNAESGIRRHDVTTVFSAVCNSPEGLEIAVNFLNNKLEDMLRMFGVKRVENIIKGAANHISSKGKAEKMRGFLMKIDSGPLKESAQTALKTISNNLAWIEKYGPEIESWLKKKYGDSSRAMQSTWSVITMSIIFIHYIFN